MDLYQPGSSEVRFEEMITYLEGVRGLVESWWEVAGISPSDQLIWLGDSLDIGLRVTRRFLVEHFARLFAFPQHSYAFTKAGDALLNVTFEGKMFWTH